MNIAGREIGVNFTPFVVAELSGEHKGALSRLQDLIIAARNAGADAAKLQLYDPIRLAERRGGRDRVVTEALWAGRTLGDLYQEAHTPIGWFHGMFAYGTMIDMRIFSSVFDEEGVDFLECRGCPAYKIASREAADVELVTKAASTGKPLIISTGTATDDELGRSIAAATMYTNQIALLYCVSEYPTRMESIDFDQIGALRHRYGLPVGFSDHTVGIEAAVEAVKAGACIIEKHVTLSRSDGGLDSAFSLEPHELAQMVKEIRNAA